MKDKAQIKITKSEIKRLKQELRWLKKDLWMYRIEWLLGKELKNNERK